MIKLTSQDRIEICNQLVDHGAYDDMLLYQALGIEFRDGGIVYKPHPFINMHALMHSNEIHFIDSFSEVMGFDLTMAYLTNYIFISEGGHEVKIYCAGEEKTFVKVFIDGHAVFCHNWDEAYQKYIRTYLAAICLWNAHA